MIMADCSPGKYNLSGVRMGGGGGVVRGIEVGYAAGVGGD